MEGVRRNSYMGKWNFPLQQLTKPLKKQLNKHGSIESTVDQSEELVNIMKTCLSDIDSNAPISSSSNTSIELYVSILSSYLYSMVEQEDSLLFSEITESKTSSHPPLINVTEAKQICIMFEYYFIHLYILLAPSQYCLDLCHRFPTTFSSFRHFQILSYSDIEKTHNPNSYDRLLSFLFDTDFKKPSLIKTLFKQHYTFDALIVMLLLRCDNSIIISLLPKSLSPQLVINSLFSINVFSSTHSWTWLSKASGKLLSIMILQKEFFYEFVSFFSKGQEHDNSSQLLHILIKKPSFIPDIETYCIQICSCIVYALNIMESTHNTIIQTSHRMMINQVINGLYNHFGEYFFDALTKILDLHNPLCINEENIKSICILSYCISDSPFIFSSRWYEQIFPIILSLYTNNINLQSGAIITYACRVLTDNYIIDSMLESCTNTQSKILPFIDKDKICNLFLTALRRAYNTMDTRILELINHIATFLQTSLINYDSLEIFISGIIDAALEYDNFIWHVLSLISVLYSSGKHLKLDTLKMKKLLSKASMMLNDNSIDETINRSFCIALVNDLKSRVTESQNANHNSIIHALILQLNDEDLNCPATRGHLLLVIQKEIQGLDPSAAHIVMDSVLKELYNQDSYVYSRAMQCIATICRVDPKSFVPRLLLLARYHPDSSPGRQRLIDTLVRYMDDGPSGLSIEVVLPMLLDILDIETCHDIKCPIVYLMACIIESYNSIGWFGEMVNAFKNEYIDGIHMNELRAWFKLILSLLKVIENTESMDCSIKEWFQELSDFMERVTILPVFVSCAEDIMIREKIDCIKDKFALK